MESSLYALLGVAPTATAEEIRAAYLAQVARYHPDRHAGNPLSDLAGERLTELNRAFEILGDPERRAQYDAQQQAGPPPPARRRPWWSRPWAILLLALALVLLLRAPFLRAVLRPGGPGPLVLVLALLAVLAAWAFLRWRARQPLRRVVRGAGRRR